MFFLFQNLQAIENYYGNHVCSLSKRNTVENLCRYEFTLKINFPVKKMSCMSLNSSYMDVHICPSLKGCGMGPWLVLVSLCSRENGVATCKIGSFLCTLDNLLQKNVIVLFFGNQISKMALI